MAELTSTQALERPSPALERSSAARLGNHRLTALVGLVLLLGLAVEGATIPFLGSLLSVHIFVGMLLLGPVALKLAQHRLPDGPLLHARPASTSGSARPLR